MGPPGWYDGGLLSLAYDLGKRLMPAFDTPLGIPVHRVNLRKGVPRGMWEILYLITGVHVLLWVSLAEWWVDSRHIARDLSG